jgi:hypothetical protein
MAFLFRKYTEDLDPPDVSQSGEHEVESEEQPPVQPLELKFFPPSPKAQIILIAAGVILINVILVAVLAIVLFMSRS